MQWTQYEELLERYTAVIGNYDASIHRLGMEQRVIDAIDTSAAAAEENIAASRLRLWHIIIKLFYLIIFGYACLIDCHDNCLGISIPLHTPVNGRPLMIHDHSLSLSLPHACLFGIRHCSLFHIIYYATLAIIIRPSDCNSISYDPGADVGLIPTTTNVIMQEHHPE